MPHCRIASVVAGVALIVPISSAAQRPVTVPADVRAACERNAPLADPYRVTVTCGNAAVFVRPDR